MSIVTIYKQSFAENLKASVPANIAKYQQDSVWVEGVASKQKRELLSNLEIKAPFTLLPPSNRDLKDLENAIRIHKALPKLTRVQARDPRLWTRLAHEEFWPYMRERWPVEKRGDSNAEGYVRERYFIPQSQSRALVRNGISRLWWIANATYDAKRVNPYELTGVVLTNLDITQTLLERGLGRAPEVVKGFLEFLLQNPDLLGGGDSNRRLIRQLAKFLNMHGGFCILDCLTSGEIIKLLDVEFAAIQKSKIVVPIATAKPV